MYVVKSVLPIPSLRYELVLFYCMKNVVWRKGHLIGLLYHALLHFLFYFVVIIKRLGLFK